MTQHETALIEINAAPVLKKERERCAKLATRLERNLAQLQRGKMEWGPAFERWQRALFGGQKARVKELEAKSEAQSHLIYRVEGAALALHCSAAEACTRVEAADRGQIVFEELCQEFECTGEFPSLALPPEVHEFLRLRFALDLIPPANHAEELEALFVEYRRDLFARMFGIEELGFEHLGVDSDNEELRLKRAYRELARRLHPDANPQLTEREHELWHEGSAAFEARDAEALENIVAVHQAGGKFSAVDSLARLRGIARSFEARLKRTASEIRRARRNEWWKFGEPGARSSPEALAERYRQEWEKSAQRLELRLGEQERRIRGWRRR